MGEFFDKLRAATDELNVLDIQVVQSIGEKLFNRTETEALAVLWPDAEPMKEGDTVGALIEMAFDRENAAKARGAEKAAKFFAHVVDALVRATDEQGSYLQRTDGTMKYHYARGKFGTAIRLLAIGKGDVRSRLYSAFLEFSPIQPERDLPGDLHDDYDWIMAQLTKYGYDPPSYWQEMGIPYEGDVQATLKRIRRNTGAKIAERIYDIHLHLQEMDDGEKET